MYRRYDSTNMWFRCQIDMIAPLVREAFATRDIDLLRGLQALAVTIWLTHANHLNQLKHNIKTQTTALA